MIKCSERLQRVLQYQVYMHELNVGRARKQVKRQVPIEMASYLRGNDETMENTIETRSLVRAQL